MRWQSMWRPDGSYKNWLKMYESATTEQCQLGADWYPNAYVYCAELADKFNISHETVIGILAVLSPQISWEQNKLCAEKLLAQEEVSGPYPANIHKAYAILDGNWILSGPKVEAFYDNILNPYNASVGVIDTHMIRSWLNDPQKKYLMRMQKRVPHLQIELAFAAEIANIYIGEFQATIWEIQRESIS